MALCLYYLNWSWKQEMCSGGRPPKSLSDTAIPLHAALLLYTRELIELDLDSTLPQHK